MLKLNPLFRSMYKLLPRYWAWGEKRIPIVWHTPLNATVDKHKCRLMGRLFFILAYIIPYRWRKKQNDCGKILYWSSRAIWITKLRHKTN